MTISPTDAIIAIESEREVRNVEINVRNIILNALENEGYFLELTKEGTIFVEDEDRTIGVAIHIDITT